MLLMFKYIHLAGTFYLSKSKVQERGLRNVELAVINTSTEMKRRDEMNLSE